MLLMIDNYDSFTYNLVQFLRELGEDVRVFRNDRISVSDATGLKPERIVISPGPCTPEQAGVSVDLIKALAHQIPILGVCLGHQAVGYAFGARIVKARTIMHGKTSRVRHDGKTIFHSIRSPFEATRYHSLVIDENTLSDDFEISARSDDDKEIMAIRHKQYPLEGVQFHPESILTWNGKDILHNFLRRT